MKSYRLTKSAREDITHIMLQQSTTENWNKLCVESSQLMRELRDHLLKEHKETFLSLPKQLLDSSSHIYVQIRDVVGISDDYLQVRYYQWSDTSKNYQIRNIPVPHNRQVCLTEEDGKDLAHKVYNLNEAFKEHKQKKDRLEKQIMGILQQHSSSKTLEEGWPEAFEIWKTYCYSPPEKTNLPATPPPSLERMLQDFPDSVPG